MLAVEDLSANWEPLSMLGLAWAHRMMYRSNWAQMKELDDGKTRWREFWWKIGSSKAVVDPAHFMFQFHLCTKAFEGICWVKLQFCKWIPHSMRLWSLLLVIAILRAKVPGAPGRSTSRARGGLHPWCGGDFSVQDVRVKKHWMSHIENF